ncbi:MAG: GIY-YIG nuclease family protein [Patescibacteria group bacterium]
MYYLYLLQCSDGSIYTGITTDIKRRFTEHKTGEGGRFTRSRKVTKILYTERFDNRSQALKREAEVKSWHRTKKLKLINA